MREHIIIVALCNRADHYVFALWFCLLSFFISSFFPRLISMSNLDVYHTSMWPYASANLERAARGSLKFFLTQKFRLVKSLFLDLI